MSNNETKAPEQILVTALQHVRDTLPGFEFISGNHPGGFIPGDRDQLIALRTRSFFVERGPAEENPTLKQLCVYALVEYDDKILCYKRGKVGGEPRLHAQRSVGVGGHINPADWDEDLPAAAVFHEALDRELREELKVRLDDHGEADFLGFVNDDQNQVGTVHLGLVYRVRLNNLDGLDFEAELVEPWWITPAALGDMVSELESWSQLLVQQVVTASAKTAEG